MAVSATKMLATANFHFAAVAVSFFPVFLVIPEVSWKMTGPLRCTSDLTRGGMFLFTVVSFTVDGKFPSARPSEKLAQCFLP